MVFIAAGGGSFDAGSTSEGGWDLSSAGLSMTLCLSAGTSQQPEPEHDVGSKGDRGGGGRGTDDRCIKGRQKNYVCFGFDVIGASETISLKKKKQKKK